MVDQPLGSVVSATQQGDANLAQNSFDRFEEYKIVVQNYAAIQSRRQAATNLFLSLNLAFIGAIGFVILVSHLNSWWTVGELGALTLAVFPVNLAWHEDMSRYGHVVVTYYGYLQEIEREFSRDQGGNRYGLPEIGMYLQQGDVGYAARHGVPRVEQRLALYFLFLYPAVTLLVAILTYLVAVLHAIQPPPSLG